MVVVLVMVLLVVASNVATLVFARTWARAPELAVRTALGAARTRVVGQLFFETLLLGSIAAAIGVDRCVRRASVHQGITSSDMAVLGHAATRPGESSRSWSFLTLLVSVVAACSRPCG